MNWIIPIVLLIGFITLLIITVIKRRRFKYVENGDCTFIEYDGKEHCRVCGKYIDPKRRDITHYGISGWMVCEEDFRAYDKWFMEKRRTHDQFKIDIRNDYPQLEFQNQ